MSLHIAQLAMNRGTVGVSGTEEIVFVFVIIQLKYDSIG